MALDESVAADSTTTVFTVDGSRESDRAGLSHRGQQYDSTACSCGIYLQDEWKITDKLTANYGARFDVFNSSFDQRKPIQPARQPDLQADGLDDPARGLRALLHAAAGRKRVAATRCNSSTARPINRPTAPTRRTAPLKAERANYFDAGITQKITPKICKSGVDGYYKHAKNQLDDGLFGQTLILSAFNYAQGEVYGVEFTGSYTDGGFSTYANVAYSRGEGRRLEFGAISVRSRPIAAYVKNHWIYLDHDQTVTGSFGTSYLWKESGRTSTRVYMDALYGSGLRADGGGSDSRHHRSHSQRRDGSGLLLHQLWRGTKFQAAKETNAESPARHREPHGQLV